MCWSANGSLSTWAFAMFLALVHKNLGTIDLPVWYLMVTFTQIQLVEYFLWKNLYIPDKNRFWSMVGGAILTIQPLVAATVLNDKQRNVFWIVYLIGIITFLLKNKIDFTTTIGGNGHLKWNWVDRDLKSVYCILWMIALLAPLWITGHHVIAAAGLITYIISSYFNDKYGTAGSYWCWIATLSWLLPFFTL